MRVTENIKAWKTLLALSAGEGFFSAAVAVDKDMAACSRMIGRLEADLGIDLIDHTHRPVQLTASGRALLPYAKALADAHCRLEEAARQCLAMPIVVRMGIPVNISRSSVFDFLKRYERIDPNLRLEILSDIDHQDLFEGKADVAYLPYRPPAEGLRLWHIGYTENCLLASPDYLKTRGEPLEPKDLAEHDLIIRSGRNYPTTKELICGEKRTPLMYKRIAFAGDVLTGQEVLLAAEGIAVDLSFHICRHEIEQGRLVRVLAGWHRPPWDLTIAVCDERVTDSRILNFCRLFAEYEKKASAMRLRHMHKFFLERDLNSR